MPTAQSIARTATNRLEAYAHSGDGSHLNCLRRALVKVRSLKKDDREILGTYLSKEINEYVQDFAYNQRNAERARALLAVSELIYDLTGKDPSYLSATREFVQMAFLDKKEDIKEQMEHLRAFEHTVHKR